MIDGIVGYIIFDSLNKKNENPNNIPTTTIKEKEYQDWSEYYAEEITKIYFSCINEDASKECILNEEGIKLSIKKENKNNLLYINDVKSSFIEQLVIESHFNIKYVEKVDNDTDYAYMSEEFEYLGNGMFSESIISETKTEDEVIKERFGLTCTDLKNSTDPRLEYHISLAKGEQ